jgi:hypothetical protein
MTASPAEVLAVAAVVYDQDTHNEADMAFLAAVAKADREWIDNLNSVKITFGPGDVFEAVKRLATRERDQSLARALAELEASEFPEFAEAAVDRPTADFLENILAPLDWTPRKQAAE